MKNKHGFTIVELLIVIVVMGILAAITIVAFNECRREPRIPRNLMKLKGGKRSSKRTNLKPVDTQPWLMVPTV